jgi:hypothetical protein
VLPGNVAHHNLAYENGSGDFANGDRMVVDLSAATNIVADPRFVDRAAHDFHLRTKSPGLTAGDPRYGTQVGAY